MERKIKPNWWIPFSFVPLMIVAILLESHLKYAVEVHEIVDVGIVIATFSLMVGWVRINSTALMEEDSAREHWVFMEESNGDEDFEIEMPTDLIPELTHLSTAQPTSRNIGLRNIDSTKGRYN